MTDAPSVSMWGESGPRPEPNHELDALFASMAADAAVTVRCTPEAAWDLVSDVTRIGEFSPECVEARWLEERGAPGVGSRFEGRNRVAGPDGTLEWVRPCVVVAWEPPARFAWTTGDRYDGTPASRWSFEIAARPHGVELRERFEHLADGLSGIRTMAEADPGAAPAIVEARVEGLRRDMAATLGRMRSILEDPARGAPPGEGPRDGV